MEGKLIQMALINLKIYSESLGMQTEVIAAIPQRNTAGEIGIDGKAEADKYKCLYLLHGLSDDHTIWMRRTSIERYAADYGICVVMPAGARSFYSDMKYGGKYYTYIAKELPAVIEEMFNVSGKREDRFIGGLSMGGYGALKIGLTETGRYAAAFGLSPVTEIHNPLFYDTLIPVFGGEIPDSADLFALAKAHENDKVKPRLYTTVGKDDFMYDDNVRFAEHMKKLPYDYKYVETDGGHNWGLWDVTVQSALKWLFCAHA